MPTPHLVESSSESLGPWLRRARKVRGLTLAALEAQTKIPHRHLDALERGQPTTLPAFYQRAEVRAVARALGVDEEQAVAKLESCLPAVEPPLSASPEPARRVRSEYVLLAGAAVLAAWMLGWGPFARSASSIAPDAIQTVAATAVADPIPPVESPPLVQATDASAVPPTDASALPPTDGSVVPPPAPVLVGTELVIHTQPEGAHVTVNGIGWGVSPVTIRHIEPGEKRVRVTLDGYAAVERSVALDEGAREAVNLRLKEFRAP